MALGARAAAGLGSPLQAGALPRWVCVGIAWSKRSPWTPGLLSAFFSNIPGPVRLLLRPSLLPLFFNLPGEVSDRVPRHAPWGFAHSCRGPRLRGSTVSSGPVWAAGPQAPHRFRGLAGGHAGARLRSGRQGCARPPRRPRGSPSAARFSWSCAVRGQGRGALQFFRRGPTGQRVVCEWRRVLTNAR